MENETVQNQFEVSFLEITQKSIFFLTGAAKWAKFLAICGFVGIGLMVIVAIFAGSMMSSLSNFNNSGFPMGGGFITVIYLIMAAIYFFPTLFCYKFAINTQKAIETNDTLTLTESFNFLHKCFQFIGIITIVMLAFVVLSVIVGVISAMAFI